MRPLFIIFLTIFVNLVGFGIIIPLLPFYAQTFGASPLMIGLLFASFSLAQLVASPLLGELSDRWGRRPVLIVSLFRHRGFRRCFFTTGAAEEAENVWVSVVSVFSVVIILLTVM